MTDANCNVTEPNIPEEPDVPLLCKKWLENHLEDEIELTIEGKEEPFRPVYQNGKEDTARLFVFSSQVVQTVIELNFANDITAATKLVEAKDAFQHVNFQKLPLPKLKVPETWSVTILTPDAVTEGVEIMLFNGKRIKFVTSMTASGLEGDRQDKPCADDSSNASDVSSSKFQIKGTFKLKVTVDLPIQFTQ